LTLKNEKSTGFINARLTRMLVTTNESVPLLSIMISGLELGDGPESQSPPEIWTLNGS
jgi:hypothetical protein